MVSGNDRIGIALFMAPALLFLSVFFLYPAVSVFFTGFTKWNGISKAVSAGFNNYKLLFTDPVFLRSIGNNIIWALSSAFIQVPLAVIAAVILSGKPRGWEALRITYFIPQVISGIAIAMLWASIYNAEYGVLNKILQTLGADSLARNWLGNLHTAFPSVLIYGLLYIGYYMVIVFADITDIPKSLYEAATIDGASGFKSTLYITVPLIVPSSFCTSVTLALVYGLRQFEQIFILTEGGPANRSSVMVLYIYQQMKNNAYGLSSAAGVVLIMIGIVVITITRKLLGSKGR